jgi:hypothetical protein
MNVKQLYNLLEVSNYLSLSMILPNGNAIPDHFHITEVGRVTKEFIDCGGETHEAMSCVLQAWTANDTDHRLLCGKLAKIVQMAMEKGLIQGDLPVEIEYGQDVAAQYVIDSVEMSEKGLFFVLSGKKTDCLAPDKCGINKCCGNTGCC